MTLRYLGSTTSLSTSERATCRQNEKEEEKDKGTGRWRIGVHPDLAVLLVPEEAAVLVDAGVGQPHHLSETIMRAKEEGREGEGRAP